MTSAPPRTVESIVVSADMASGRPPGEGISKTAPYRQGLPSASLAVPIAVHDLPADDAAKEWGGKVPSSLHLLPPIALPPQAPGPMQADRAIDVPSVGRPAPSGTLAIPAPAGHAVPVTQTSSGAEDLDDTHAAWRAGAQKLDQAFRRYQAARRVLAAAAEASLPRALAQHDDALQEIGTACAELAAILSRLRAAASS